MIDYEDWLLNSSEYSDRCPICSGLLESDGHCERCEPTDWPEDDE